LGLQLGAPSSKAFLSLIPSQALGFAVVGDMKRVDYRLLFCLFACGATLIMASAPESDVDNVLNDVALPDVDVMLSEASETVSSLSKTAEKLEAAMNATQRHHQAQLNSLRAHYASRLAEQDDTNEKILDENNKLKREADSLDVGNQLIRKSAKELQDINTGMRSMFKALTPKFLAAKLFLTAAINASEASVHTKESEALRDPSPPPSLESFLQSLRTDENSDRHHSLLGQKSAVRRTGATAAMKKHARAVAETSAEDIVNELSQEMSKLGQAHEEGDLKMRATFLANFEARQLKTDQLLLEQKDLNATRTKALEQQRDLYAAKKALLQVNTDLVSRMKGLSTFAVNSNQYVLHRLAMANNATDDDNAKANGLALMQSSVNATSMSGRLVW